MSVLTYEKKGRVAWITLNRPEKMNALNGELIAELAKTWVAFRDDPEVWVAVLTGAGRAFCVGADFAAIGEPGIQIGFNILREDPTNYTVYKPIIAAINGAVIGRGMSLALACDLRIATDKAEFSVPEAKFGVIPGDADLLQRFVGPTVAREMYFMGDKISAQRAYEVGLLNKVVPQDELIEATTAIAEKLASNAPLALQGIKEMFMRAGDMNYKTALSIYETVNSRLLTSQDYPEGMKAMAERRKPNWQGK